MPRKNINIGKHSAQLRTNAEFQSEVLFLTLYNPKIVIVYQFNFLKSFFLGADRLAWRIEIKNRKSSSPILSVRKINIPQAENKVKQRHLIEDNLPKGSTTAMCTLGNILMCIQGQP